MAKTAGVELRRFVWPIGARNCRLDGVLRETLADASWSQCRRWIETGKVAINGELTLNSGATVEPGDEISINPTAPRPTKLDAFRVRLLYHDAHIVVAEKPSGVSTVPFDEQERGTFDELVRHALERLGNRRLPPLGIVHRIDKETSGLVVFARTLPAKRHLKQQFRFHTNHRAYLAIASGQVQGARIQSRIVSDRGDGRRGSTENSRIGQLATTHVEVVERFQQATLIRCRLETGRTHQIRIHLAELGHPLLGERVYGSISNTNTLDAARLMLHAAELGIDHPAQERRLDFSSEPPEDFGAVVERLRQCR